MKIFLILFIGICFSVAGIGQQALSDSSQADHTLKSDTDKSVRQHFVIKSQKDLVFNPSFELHSNLYKPGSLGLLDSNFCWGWRSSNDGVPQYCWSDSIMQTSGRSYGFSGKARTGNACIGMIITQPGVDMIQHIRGTLIEPLEAGHYYKVSFWVRLNNISQYATYNIGALLTKNRILSQVGVANYIESMNPELKPSVSNPVNNFLTDTNWTQISGVFRAKGGERYITIGMFWDSNPEMVKAWLAAHPIGYVPYRKEFTQFVNTMSKYLLIANKNFDKSKIGYVSKVDMSLSCYYIDDVSVKPVLDNDTTGISRTNDTSKNPTPGLLNIEMNKDIVFDRVLFEKGRSDYMLDISRNELDQLISYLQENDNTVIKISAYTDNSKSKVICKAISDRRAAAVAQYLIGRIDAKRVKYKGYGSANPIASNDTKKGRAKNYRVEFRIENK